MNDWHSLIDSTYSLTARVSSLPSVSGRSMKFRGYLYRRFNVARDVPRIIGFVRARARARADSRKREKEREGSILPQGHLDPRSSRASARPIRAFYDRHVPDSREIPGSKAAISINEYAARVRAVIFLPMLLVSGML